MDEEKPDRFAAARAAKAQRKAINQGLVPSAQPGEEPAVAEPAEAAGVLSAAEIEEIKEKARRETREQIAKELRAAEIARIVAEIEQEERLAAGLEEAEETGSLAAGVPQKRGAPVVPESEKVEIMVGLPPFADRITIDGKVYMNGHTYRVSRDQYLSFVDQMQHSWRHDDEIHGKWFDFGRRQRDTHILHGRVTGVPLLHNGAVINTSRGLA